MNKLNLIILFFAYLRKGEFHLEKTFSKYFARLFKVLKEYHAGSF